MKYVLTAQEVMKLCVDECIRLGLIPNSGHAYPNPVFDMQQTPVPGGTRVTAELVGVEIEHTEEAR